MMCRFSFDLAAMYADLNISLVNDSENKNSRTKTHIYHHPTVSGCNGCRRDGKGGDQGSLSQFGHHLSVQQLLFPEKHEQGLLCTLVKDPIVNAEYN